MKIYLLQPDSAPLYVLVSKLNKRVAINTTFSWLDDDLQPSWTYLAASATSAETALTTATSEGVYFNKYDLVKLPLTGEIMLVTNSTTSAITAVRGLNKAIVLDKLYLMLGTLDNFISPEGGKLYERDNQQDRLSLVSILH